MAEHKCQCGGQQCQKECAADVKQKMEAFVAEKGQKVAKVVKYTTQVVAGVMHHFELELEGGKKAKARVWQKTGAQWSLEEFTMM